MLVQLKNDAGQNLGTSISSGDQPTRSAAESAIAAVIAQRVADAQQTAGALVDAQTAFSS